MNRKFFVFYIIAGATFVSPCMRGFSFEPKIATVKMFPNNPDNNWF
jgi:hypothetical protein